MPLDLEETNFKLIYYDIRALGEPIRLMFRYAGIPFEDVRVPHLFTRENEEKWAEMKPKMPYGVLPVLEFTDRSGERQQLSHSQSINRFLATKFGLAGRDDFEQAKADELAEWSKDFWFELGPYFCVFSRDLLSEGYTLPKRSEALIAQEKRSKEEMREQVFQPMLNERILPIVLENLKKSGSAFLLPSGLTWVDFVFAEFFLTLNIMEQQFGDSLFTKYPELGEYVKRVHSVNQAVKNYVEKRPKQFPIFH